MLLNSSGYFYGDPNNPDAFTEAVQNGVNASYSYTADVNLTDYFGVKTPRLTGVTVGAAGDTRSSDDGGSIQGVMQQVFGWMQTGVDAWSEAARTVSSFDAYGREFKAILELAGGGYGAITAINSTGPAFTGAPANSNVNRVVYGPDINHPAFVEVHDPLLLAGFTTLPWRSEFDAAGNLLRATNPMGQSSVFEYSGDGLRLLSVKDPTNITWNFGWGENGSPLSRLTSVTDPGGNQRARTDYNAFGQPVRVTTPAGATVYDYHATTGDLTRVTDPLGDVLTVDAYDALGDPLSVTVYPDTGDPATSQTPLRATRRLNAAQQVMEKRLANGSEVVNTWQDGRLTQIQTHAPPANGARGLLLARTNVYNDSRGRMYKAEDLVGVTAQYRYDRNSNLTRILDGEGRATRFTYGPMNEPTGIVWPDGNASQLRYDAGGRLREATDERGVVSRCLYDEASRLQRIEFPATPAENVALTYDAAGRPLTVTDSSGSRIYAYDPIYRRLQSVTTLLSGLPQGSNVFIVSYTYRLDGRVETMTCSATGTTAYEYNAAVQLSRLTDPYGNVTAWAYDHAGRPTSETTTSAAGAVIRTGYGYGNSGQDGARPLPPPTCPTSRSPSTALACGTTR